MRILLVVITVLTLVASVASADGVNKVPVSISNQSGLTILHGRTSVLLDSNTLSSGLYMDSQALKTDVTKGTEHIGFMPGSGNIAMLGCFSNAGVSQSAACNNVSTQDMTLPAGASQVFEFTAHNQWSSLLIVIDTAAVADWTIVWEYWNGSAYVALANVNDGSNHFQNGGSQRIKWDFPAAGLWPKSTLHSISGYWIRARVSNFVSLTTAPDASRAWYQIGRWWVQVDSLAANEETLYNIQLDTKPQQHTMTFNSSITNFGVQGVGPVYPPSYSGIGYNVGFENKCLPSKSKSTQYDVRNCLLAWNTSDLPDNVDVTSASLKCNTGNITNINGRSLQLEWFGHSGPPGESHYTTTSQGNAHAGIPLSSMTSGSVVFNLINLYRINPRGRTSIRGHITGGSPTGGNYLTLSDCILTVNYAGKTHHQYFPGPGYTIPDSADMEPGSAFSLVIAGYFDMRAGFKVLWGKTGQRFGLETHPTADNILRISANGGTHVQFTGIASGYHIFELQGVASGVTLIVDGVEKGAAATVSIADVTNSWVSATNGSVVYFDYIVYEVNQGERLVHRLTEIPGKDLMDHSGNGHTIIASYPETTNTYEVSVGNVTPNPYQDLEDEGEYTPSSTPPAVESILDSFGETSSSLGVPLNALKPILAIAGAIFLGCLVAAVFKEALPAAGAMIMALVVFSIMGAIPIWVVFIFFFPVLLFLIWKRASP